MQPLFYAYSMLQANSAAQLMGGPDVAFILCLFNVTR